MAQRQIGTGPVENVTLPDRVQHRREPAGPLVSAPGQASGDEAVGTIGNPVNRDAIEASPDPSPASVAACGS